MGAVIDLFTAFEHGPVPSKLNLHAGAFCLSPSKENAVDSPTLVLSGSRAALPREQPHVIMWVSFPTGAYVGAWCPGGW